VAPYDIDQKKTDTTRHFTARIEVRKTTTFV
jgi:hypothetical protein